MNKINLHPRSLDSGFRLFLEGMKHPDIRINLDRIEHTKGIAAMSRGDFEDTTVDAMERLCLLRLSALGCHGEPIEHVTLDVLREFLEVPPRGLYPGDLPSIPHSGIVSKFDNI